MTAEEARQLVTSTPNVVDLLERVAKAASSGEQEIRTTTELDQGEKDYLRSLGYEVWWDRAMLEYGISWKSSGNTTNDPQGEYRGLTEEQKEAGRQRIIDEQIEESAELAGEMDDLPWRTGEQPKREPLSLLMVQKMLKRIDELVIASEGLVDEEYGLAKEALEFLRNEITEGRLAKVIELSPEPILQFMAGSYRCRTCKNELGNIYTPDGLGNFCRECGTKVGKINA